MAISATAAAIGGAALGGLSGALKKKAPSPQSSFNLLPPELQETVLDVAQRARDISEQPYDPYLGERIAGFTPDQLNAFERVRGGIGQYENIYQDLYSQAGNLATQAIEGPTAQDIQQRMSPYMQGVVDVAKQEAIGDFDNVLKGIRDRAVNAGAFGGDRMGIVESEGYEDLLDRLSNIQTQGLQTAYGQAVDQFNTGLSMGSNLLSTSGNLAGAGEAARYRGIGALSDIGTQQQALDQRGLDVDYTDYLLEQEYPKEQVDFLTGTLGGISPFFSGSYTPPQKQSKFGNILSGAIGGGLTGASLAGGFGGGGGAPPGAPGYGQSYYDQRASMGFYGPGYKEGGYVKKPSIGNYAEGEPVKKYFIGGLVPGIGNFGDGGFQSSMFTGLIPLLMGGGGSETNESIVKVLQGDEEASKKKKDKKGQFGRTLGQVIGTYFGGPIGGTIGGTLGSQFPFQEGGYVKKPSIVNYAEGGPVSSILSNLGNLYSFVEKIPYAYLDTVDYFTRDEPSDIEKMSKKLVRDPNYKYQPGSRIVQDAIELDKQNQQIPGGPDTKDPNSLPRIFDMPLPVQGSGEDISMDISETDLVTPTTGLVEQLTTGKGQPQGIAALINQMYDQQPQRQQQQTSNEQGERKSGINMPLLNAGIALLANSSDLNRSIASGLKAFADTTQAQEQAEAETQQALQEQRREDKLQAIKLQMELNKERRAQEYLEVQKGFLQQKIANSGKSAIEGLNPIESDMFQKMYPDMVQQEIEIAASERREPNIERIATQTKQAVKAASGSSPTVLESPIPEVLSAFEGQLQVRKN